MCGQACSVLSFSFASLFRFPCRLTAALVGSSNVQ